jgi:hypothetical protein
MHHLCDSKNDLIIIDEIEMSGVVLRVSQRPTVDMGIKRYYEAMGFHAPRRNVQGGPIIYSDLVNNLPKAFNLKVLKIGDTPAQLYKKPAKAPEGLTPSTPAGEINLINASKLTALRKKKQSLKKMYDGMAMYDEMAYNTLTNPNPNPKRFLSSS